MNYNLILRIAGICIFCIRGFRVSAEIREYHDPDSLVYIFIGKGREYESLNDFFVTAEEKSNVHVIVDPGDYYSEELTVRGNNITIEGRGKVNLYCSNPDQNVMWVEGSHITIKNFHMKHKGPVYLEFHNCTGRVIAFEGASYVTIEKCNLNGCGLSGLHDNANNSNITIKNNYIHKNSVGAYTDLEGNVWQKEIKDHPVFTFINNRMRNNGNRHDRVEEETGE